MWDPGGRGSSEHGHELAVGQGPGLHHHLVMGRWQCCAPLCPWGISVLPLITHHRCVISATVVKIWFGLAAHLPHKLVLSSSKLLRRHRQLAPFLLQLIVLSSELLPRPRQLLVTGPDLAAGVLPPSAPRELAPPHPPPLLLVQKC